MKICMLTTSFPRYKGDLYLSFAYSLAKELAKKNEIYVVSSHGLKTKSYEKRDNIKISRYSYFLPRRYQMLTYRGGMIENYKKSFFAKMQLIPFFVSFFFKGLKVAKKADIIHAQVILSGLVGVVIKKFLKKPLVLTVHGTGINNIKSRLSKFLARFVFDNCDKVITVSNDLKSTLVNKLRVDRNKVVVIPNGVDFSVFKKTDKARARRKLGLPADKKIILFVGRLNKEKGLDYLIKALDKVKDFKKGILLLVIGEGAEKENFMKSAKNLKLERFIRFVGAKSHDELHVWMNSANLLVLPSLSEGFGLVLIEAMACGTAVIGTKVGGVVDIVDNNKNGIVVEPRNVGQLYKSIIYLIKNKKIADKLASEGMEKVRKNFNWEKCAKDTLQIYKEITNV